MAKNKDSFQKVHAAEEEKNTVPGAIIGTYEGECADANITNLNGLDITREVWEHVFSSEEYERGIKYGWFIGFLGHPNDDADCQDFEHACIVMTEGHIDENGKVFGKFNLVDTPVGRIVKVFQDAGVIFGISVRGAGDIIQNSVDPDTFVFRGFDLVAFPAFPESIPTFTKIAASSDAKQRQKYQAVCAAVKDNISSLTTVQSVDMIQSCFAKQSDEYQALEERKAEIIGSEPIIQPMEDLKLDPEGTMKAAGMSSCEDEECIDPRVDAMTKLYLDLKEKYETLALAHANLQSMYDQLSFDSRRKLESVERICSSQMNDLNRTLEKVEGSLKAKTAEAYSIRRKFDTLDRRYTQIQGSVSTKTKKISELEAKLEKVQASLDARNEDNRKLIADLRKASNENRQLQAKNLKYNEKVETAQNEIESKKTIISSLQSKLDETVRKQAQEKQKSSNRDDQMASMKARVEAAESLTRDYQDAYANLYANAVGVRLPQLQVTATTDVDSLQKMIRASTSIAVKPDILEPTQGVDPSYFDVADYEEDGLVTV